jgi:Protein of unknown function (DUF2474)
MQRSAAGSQTLLKRIGWLLLLWALGVLSLGAVAIVLRLVMNAAGLTV